MKRVAALVVFALVAVACEDEPPMTHESLEGNEAGVSPETGCIWVVDGVSGDREVFFATDEGDIADCFPSQTTTTTTTSTVPDTTTTTTVPETTTTTTTVPPTTSTTTTTVPETTTTLPPDNTGQAFTATFNDGDDDLNNLFNYGVWHRDNNVVAMTSWPGDHDLSCGSPDTQRIIARTYEDNREGFPYVPADPSGTFYQCRNHLMTAVGDTSGYSIAWFSPKQTFNGQTEVSIDVNSTMLGQRQWWEVSLVPADYESGVPGCEWCISGASAVSSFFPTIPENTLVFGIKGGGNRLMVDYESTRSVNKLCLDGANSLDPEGCQSKPIRRTWTATDNGNGTVTITAPELGVSYTTDGSFPDGEWRLVVKDHNYTPLKDCEPGDSGHDPTTGTCLSFTWHWDNLLVT